MKFKVGDRVAVYGGIHNIPGSPQLDGMRGTVLERPDNEFPGNLYVELDGEVEKGEPPLYWLHPKQCRKLSTKPRRRIWVPKSNQSVDLEDVRTVEDLNPYLDERPHAKRMHNYTEFVEVRRRK